MNLPASRVAASQGLRERMGHPARTRIVQWVLGLTAALIVAPVIFMAIQGMVGIMLAGVLGLLGVNLAPVVAFKLTHLKLGLMRSEAQHNPMVTLEGQLIEARQSLDRATSGLQTVLAHIDDYVDKARGYGRKYPQDAQRWEQHLAQALQLREHKKSVLRSAVLAVGRFEEEVERARIEWTLVQAERAMARELGAALADPTHELLQRTALDSVQLEVKRAFASLDVELIRQVEPALVTEVGRVTAARAGQMDAPGSDH